MKKWQLSAAILLLFAPTMLLGQSPAPADDVTDRMIRLEAETQALREEVKRLREDTVRLPPSRRHRPAWLPLLTQPRRRPDKETISPWTSFAEK